MTIKEEQPKLMRSTSAEAIHLYELPLFTEDSSDTASDTASDTVREPSPVTTPAVTSTAFTSPSQSPPRQSAIIKRESSARRSTHFPRAIPSSPSSRSAGCLRHTLDRRHRCPCAPVRPMRPRILAHLASIDFSTQEMAGELSYNKTPRSHHAVMLAAAPIISPAVQPQSASGSCQGAPSNTSNSFSAEAFMRRVNRKHARSGINVSEQLLQ